MSNIPLDLERRCEQRWAARFEAARVLREQHRLERQRQQLAAPDNSKRETRAEAAGLRSVAAVCERGTEAMRAVLAGPVSAKVRVSV